MDKFAAKLASILDNPNVRIALVMLVLWAFGSMGIIYLETGDLADVGNAIWWTIVTITTVIPT